MKQDADTVPPTRTGHLARTLHRGWDLEAFGCVDAAESDPPEDPGRPGRREYEHPGARVGRHPGARVGRHLRDPRDAAEREKLARRIHAERNGSPHAFRVIPCSHRRSSDLETALTNGIQPGTYYLADVDALDVRMQALVCRFLERSASHTVIAATGQDLFALVDTPFSTTLFYRLNVIHLVIG